MCLSQNLSYQSRSGGDVCEGLNPTFLKGIPTPVELVSFYDLYWESCGEILEANRYTFGFPGLAKVFE